VQEQPILILSSWLSGANLVNGFLGECGAYLCPPFSKASDGVSNTHESFYYRGILAATIDEESLEFKAEATIFKNGFQDWYKKQLPDGKAAGSSRISLAHPLSAFLLHEICKVVNPTFVVLTRPFDQIESTRSTMNAHENLGRIGAQKIYDQIFSYLTDNSKTFLTISFEDFMKSIETRLKLLDYCDLDVSDFQAEEAFTKVTAKTK
jgi:hypothetical protein